MSVFHTNWLNTIKLDEISSTILGVLAFLLVTPFDNNGIPLASMGSGGLFVAIIMSLLAIEIVNLIVKKNIIIKMPDSVPPAVSKSFAALIPGFFVILVSLIIRIAFEVSPFGNGIN